MNCHKGWKGRISRETALISKLNLQTANTSQRSASLFCQTPRLGRRSKQLFYRRNCRHETFRDWLNVTHQKTDDFSVSELSVICWFLAAINNSRMASDDCLFSYRMSTPGYRHATGDENCEMSPWARSTSCVVSPTAAHKSQYNGEVSLMPSVSAAAALSTTLHMWIGQN